MVRFPSYSRVRVTVRITNILWITMLVTKDIPVVPPDCFQIRIRIQTEIGNDEDVFMVALPSLFQEPSLSFKVEQIGFVI